MGKTATCCTCIFLLPLLWAAQILITPTHFYDPSAIFHVVNHWIWKSGLNLYSIEEEYITQGPLSHARPPIVEIPMIEGRWEDVKDEIASRGRHMPILLIRNFSTGWLDDYNTYENFVANTNNDMHPFNKNHLGLSKQEGEGKTFEHMGLHDALARMKNGEKIYGGFMHDILRKNPKLEDAISRTMERLLEVPELAHFSTEAKYEATMHHCFVYYGNWSWALLHNAPIEDAFLQISNTKVWYFTIPEYIPYMRQICNGVGGCRFVMDPRDQDRIPFVKFTTNPGDLMVFPPYWPHAVGNLHNTFGFGVGIRPKPQKYTVRHTIMPALAARGAFWPTFNVWMRILASGRRYKPGFNHTLQFNDDVLEEVARTLSNKYDLHHPDRISGHMEPYKGPPETCKPYDS